MSLFCRQFRILLWKNYLLKKRHYYMTFLEIFIPLLMSTMMVFTIASSDPNKTLIPKRGAPRSSNITIEPSSDDKFKAIFFKDPVYNMTEKLESFLKSGVKLNFLIIPNNKCVDKFLKIFDNQLKMFSPKFRSVKYEQLNDPHEIDAKFSSAQDLGMLVIGIIFHNQCYSNYGKFLKNFVCTIRTLGPDGINFKRKFPDKHEIGPFNYSYYLGQNQQGFIETLNLLNLAYLSSIKEKMQIKRNFSISNIAAYRYPFLFYMDRPPVTLVDIVPSVVVYSFVFFFPLVVKQIVQENHDRSRDMFKLMGLNDLAYYGSTFIIYLGEILIQAFLLTFLYTFQFNDSTAVFQNSNPFTIFLVLVIYGINLILVGIMFSIFFKSPNIAIIFSTVFYLLNDITQYFLDPKYNKTVAIDSEPIKTLQVIFCLLPTVSVKFSMRVFIFIELYSRGVSFAHLFETTYLYGYLSIGLILAINSCSILLNLILIYYLKNVWPFQHGLVEPWYFPVSPILKLCIKEVEEVKIVFKDKIMPKLMTKEMTTTKSEFDSVDAKYFEEEVAKTQIKLSVQQLVKKYGKKTVLSLSSLNLYENQLTALLGQNGAGKTTLMNIITGLTSATSGKVLINGFDMKKDAQKARSSLSLCPQHNILYDELTAYEHLMIYGTIKGQSTSEELEAEIDDLLEKFQLKLKKNEISGSYSGGMKRKLNLAIALVGQSKIVILDEPTAGIDSESRRVVWDVLIKEKRRRTILLTSHSIEEIDVLGDRILIICKGKARCYGSPSFLKSIFGMGYQLRIAKDEKFNGIEGAQTKLETFIRKFFKNSEILDENVGELVYSLDRSLSASKEELGTSVFTRFFIEFEKIRTVLHISTFGITLITLEDIFLKIIYQSNEKDQESDRKLSLEKILNDNKVISFLEDKGQANIQNSYRLFYQRFKAMIIKRLNHSKRYYPALVFQLVVPLLMFSLILYLDNYLKPIQQAKETLILDKEMYGKSIGFFKDNTGDGRLLESYQRSAQNAQMTISQLDWNTKPDVFIANKSQQESTSIYLNVELFGGVVHKSPNSTDGLSNLDLEIWFNNEASHALPIALSTMFRALFDYAVDLGAGYQEVHIIDQPFSNPANIVSAIQIINGLKVMWCLLTSLCLPFLSSSYAMFPIHEYVSKSKLLQKMAGSTGCLYWLSAFIFDVICHTIVCAMIMLIFYLQDHKSIFIAFQSSTDSLFTLFFLFGLSSIQISYVLSRLFSSVSTGFLTIMIANLIFGVILVIIEFFISYLDTTETVSEHTLNTIHWCFRIFPIYSVARGVSNLYITGSQVHLCDRLTDIQRFCGTAHPVQGCCLNCTKNCFTYDNPFVWSAKYGITKEIITMFAVFVVCFTLNLIIENDLISKLVGLCIPVSKLERMHTVIAKRSDSEILQNPNEDPDLIQEQRRVELMIDQKTKDKSSMLVYHLSKAFYKFIAVNDLSFALNKKECFGLLGVNGAGKTTTFRMLVGDLEPTEGTAYIKNHNLRTDLNSFQNNIGYCPQFDALLDNLTGEEMLYLFGRLRGIKEQNLDQVVNYIIKMVDLKRHSKSLCVNYSGGNKRKLSLGMALIGLPKIIFLDEPTAGVDPEARRKIWATLVFVRQKFNCSIVLTTHDLTECEALCSRVAIMVAGKFKCLNSVQNLRQKYGRGYTLTIKLRPGCLDRPFYLSKLREKIKHVFPSAVCKDFHETLLSYQIADHTLKWSFLFEKMDEIRTEFQLEYYLLSDTTLESIFIDFAKSHGAP